MPLSFIHLTFPDGFQATDAKLIAELRSRFLTALNKVTPDAEGSPERLVITTPNANWLPEVHVGTQLVTYHEDGRWGIQDFAQWPQWAFDGQSHFAYILRKPPQHELPKHPLRRLWYDMSREDFVFEGASQIGQLKPSIAQELYDIRVGIMKEVEACKCECGEDYRSLTRAAWTMRSCTSTLLYTPQEYHEVLLILTSGQRATLETRALLDKINKWDKIPASAAFRPVNHDLLGCVTDRVPLAFEMYAKGVPVWLVRPPSLISAEITIISEAATTTPAKFGINTKVWPEAPEFYQGPLARAIHESIQKWQPGCMRMNLLENVAPAAVDEDATSNDTDPCHESRLAKAKPYTKMSSSKDHSSGMDAPRQSPPSRRNAAGKSKASGRLPSSIRFSVNNERFSEVTSQSSSQPLPQWSKSLAEVKRDVDLVDHPLLSLFRGFAFPPPGIFEKRDGGLISGSMLAWLLIRTSWIPIISSPARTLPLPNPSQWRNYLHRLSSQLELIAQPPMPSTSKAVRESSSKDTQRARTCQKQWDQAVEIFSVNVPPKDAISLILWNGHVVWQNKQVELSILDRKLVAWDTQEHNFRLELWTLDRCVLADQWGTPEGRAEREQKIRAIWPDEVMFNVILPISPRGIGSVQWEERRPYVEAFYRIIVDWPVKGINDLAKAASKGWDSVNSDNIERLASKVYCQTFFDYFGRAPCIPHSLPTI